MNQCEKCGKGTMRGLAVSHAKNRSKKVYKPNLHTVRVGESGQSKKMTLCTKCLREIKSKNPKILKAKVQVGDKK